MSDLFSINSLASHAALFGASAKSIGFASTGEIDRFIFNAYGKALASIAPPDRPRGAMFVLEPASVKDALVTPAALVPELRIVQARVTETLYSLRLDFVGGLEKAYSFTHQDKSAAIEGGWTIASAQLISREANKCVVWAMGVSVAVVINGDIYRQSPDVMEAFGGGVPGGFQDLSWEDGRFLFHFAALDLNEGGAVGVWHIADEHLLKPKPESIIRGKLGKYLRFRLAGYAGHYEEALVENEGRADISLHLIDGRTLIVELKWLGCSVTADKANETVADIQDALKKNAKGWFTRFDEKSIASGVKQLVSYYKTGTYRRAYLALFDCRPSSGSSTSCYLPVPSGHLSGHDPENFRLLHAITDPRSASVRAKKK